jgi:hypothetical protein
MDNLRQDTEAQQKGVGETRPPAFGIYGGFMEYSFFLPQKDLDALYTQEGRFSDYVYAMWELDKEFPTPQIAPKKGEVECSTQIWVPFGT